MFKNVTLYRLGAPAIDPAQIAAAILESGQFYRPIGNQEVQSQGFVPPREGEHLVATVGRQMFLKFRTEKKLLPAAVINEATAARCAELEEQQGFAPGRKATREIRERVTDELLPRAFSTSTFTRVWLDPVNGWFVVDSSTPSKCDAIVRAILKACDRFPLESVRVNRSPVGVMTEWLASDEVPAAFTVDQDTELRATGESKATVKFVRHSLDPDDIGRHIAAGKQCTQLALTWNSKISFVLTAALTLKRVEALDVLKENETVTHDDDERFAADMTLMTGELSRMFADLVDVLGGEAK
jgi:recombination associated protein RdgC